MTTSDLIGWAQFDCTASLTAIRCPVHLVVGDDDLWLDARSVKDTAEAIPGARFTLLEGIGHYPMEEIDDIAARLDAWLSDLAKSRHDRSLTHS